MTNFLVKRELLTCNIYNIQNFIQSCQKKKKNYIQTYRNLFTRAHFFLFEHTEFVGAKFLYMQNFSCGEYVIKKFLN